LIFVCEPSNGVGLLMAISFAVLVVVAAIVDGLGGFSGIGKSTTKILGSGVGSGNRKGSLGSGVVVLEKIGGLDSASGSVSILSLEKTVSISGDGVGLYLVSKIVSGSISGRNR